ncbi:MAG: phage tail assembly chaperone [Proteobacteria bacterium]|nr:phage tail assembly chaperone [Pseudomonadota bacterium]MBS0572452.1 phage tail assembly chaperone [Pseudomonadota bacterium]
MRAGMAGLGLRPDEFWRLTPAELAVMLGEPVGQRPMGQAQLDDLRRQWPDAAEEAGE